MAQDWILHSVVKGVRVSSKPDATWCRLKVQGSLSTSLSHVVKLFWSPQVYAQVLGEDHISTIIQGNSFDQKVKSLAPLLNLRPFQRIETWQAETQGNTYRLISQTRPDAVAEAGFQLLYNRRSVLTLEPHPLFHDQTCYTAECELRVDDIPSSFLQGPLCLTLRDKYAEVERLLLQDSLNLM